MLLYFNSVAIQKTTSIDRRTLNKNYLTHLKVTQSFQIELS